MRIVRYELDGAIRYGVIEDGGYRRLRASPFESLDLSEVVDDAARARLLCPLDMPRIFGVGLNYVSHIQETGLRAPERPMFFMKPSTAANGPDMPIVYPLEGRNVHFEAELAAVIARRTRRVTPQQALESVLGYTCANDVSERIIQREEMAMGCLLVGKAFDGFCPLGPCIATGLDPTRLRMEGRVNGELRQSIETSDLLFSVAALVSYLSEAITLLPGDVIITGTPSGVGPVVPGDRVDIWIEGIGTLTNTVAAEAATGQDAERDC